MTEIGSSTALVPALSPGCAAGERESAARPATLGPRPRLAVFVIALLCTQVTLFALLIGGFLGASGYSLAHLGSCAAAWRVRGWAGQDGSVRALQILALTACAGPFGAMVSVGLLASPDHCDGPMEDREHAPASPPQSRSGCLHAALLDQRLRLHNAHAAEPLGDVMAEGTQSDKFEALRIIAMSYEPALAPVLRGALADGSAPVRVLAASIVAKLTMAHRNRVGALEIEAAGAPGDRKLLRKLARARLDLAESGLLDVSQSREQAARARQELASSAEINRNGG